MVPGIGAALEAPAVKQSANGDNNTTQHIIKEKLKEQMI